MSRNCPKWLDELLLHEHSKQITYTDRFDASAEGVITRLLRGSDGIDKLVTQQLESCDCAHDPYFKGLYNGLLMAQATLQDGEYKPL